MSSLVYMGYKRFFSGEDVKIEALTWLQFAGQHKIMGFERDHYPELCFYSFIWNYIK